MTDRQPQHPPARTLQPWLGHLQHQTTLREQANLRRQIRCINTAEQHHRLFCSNDYLGLSQHPALIRAMQEGASRYGAGSCASHLISGHSPAHEALAQCITQWMQHRIAHAQTLTFSTGYMANMGVLTALADRNTTIFSDRLNHASIVDGCRLAAAGGATVHRYRHADTDNLSQLLEKDAQTAAGSRQQNQSSCRRRIIITDGVFSMDGDIAPLPALLQLAQQYGALLAVDDAHGIGVLGADGQGSLQYTGLPAYEGLVLIGTLGKAAGAAGAFVCAHSTIIDHLIQTARSYIYTTAQPPAVAHALCHSVQLMRSEEGKARREQLRMLIQHLRSGLQQICALRPAWSLLPSHTPIQPLTVGDNSTALMLAQGLLDAGWQVPAIRPPTVPQGSARLRFTLHAAHQLDDVDALLEQLQRLALSQ